MKKDPTEKSKYWLFTQKIREPHSHKTSLGEWRSKCPPLAVLQTYSMTDTNFTSGSDVGGIVMFWDTAHKSDGWLFTEAARNN